MLEEIADLPLANLFSEQAHTMTQLLKRQRERLEERFPAVPGLPAALVHPTALVWSTYKMNWAASKGPRGRLSCHSGRTSERLPRASALRRVRQPRSNEAYFRPLGVAQVGERAAEIYLDMAREMARVDAWRSALRASMQCTEVVPDAKDLLDRLISYQGQNPGVVDVEEFAATQSPRSIGQWRKHLAATESLLRRVSSHMHQSTIRMQGVILPILEERRVIPFFDGSGVYMRMMRSEVYAAGRRFVSCWQHIAGEPIRPTQRELLQIKRRGQNVDDSMKHAFSLGQGRGSVATYLQQFDLVLIIYAHYEQHIEWIKSVFAPLRSFHGEYCRSNGIANHAFLDELDRFGSQSFGADLPVASEHHLLLGSWSQIMSKTKTNWRTNHVNKPHPKNAPSGSDPT